MKSVESRTRVRYKETDQMGIAHHSNYIVWFEVGRTDLCRATGNTYRDIEERGYLLVVVEIGCRFRTPYRYDDEVVIKTRIGEAGSRMLRFEYELSDSVGELRATGFSRHVWLERETRKPVKADAEVMRAFGPWLP
ncbi:MAG TPA: thioesterase family protein [Thermoanaerobaculia bacterium]